MAAQTGGVVARGVAWMLLARVADRVGGILAIALTARYLGPADFGMFQMAMSVVILIELFSTFGFEWTLMRHPDPQREHYDTAFTLQVMVSVTAALLVLALAWPFAAYYRTPQLVAPTMVMALIPLIHGVNNLAVAHLRRQMRFETDFWRMCIPRIVSLVAVIAFAWWWQSYWALIGGVLVAKISSCLMGYILHPYRPRLSLAKWRELLGFTMWMQLSNVIEGLRLRVADLVIGRMLGSHSLAIYNMSNELATLPQSEFVGAVNSAVFTKYSKIQNDVAQLRTAYLDILSLTLMIGLPVACGLMLVAPCAVRVLLGSSWADAAPVIQIVAFGALANGVATNTPFVLMTAGRPNLNTRLSAMTLALMVAALLVLTRHYGLIGAAAGFTAVALIALPVHFLVLRRVIGLGLGEIVPRVWRSMAAAILMCIAVWPIVPSRMPATLPEALVDLIQAMTVGGIVYTGTVAVLWIASGRPAAIERMLYTTALDIIARVGERMLGWRQQRRA